MDWSIQQLDRQAQEERELKAAYSEAPVLYESVKRCMLASVDERIPSKYVRDYNIDEVAMVSCLDEIGFVITIKAR